MRWKAHRATAEAAVGCGTPGSAPRAPCFFSNEVAMWMWRQKLSPVCWRRHARQALLDSMRHGSRQPASNRIGLLSAPA